MNYIHLAIFLSIVSCTNVPKHDNCIKLLFPEHFSNIIKIKAKFIQSPNHYYAKNNIKENYYIQVLEINGRKINSNVPIELDTIDPNKYKVGEVHELLVFEKLKELGEPNHIGYFNYSQYTLHYRNKLKEVTEPVGLQKIEDMYEIPTPPIPNMENNQKP